MSDDKSGQCEHGYYGLCPRCYETLRARVAELEAQIAAPAAAVADDVAKYRHHLELLRDDCTYPAGHVGAVVLNGHRMEIIRDALTAILAARQPSQDVVRDALFCVGRAKFPPRGGNVGLQWHVVGVADVPYRTCVPKDGELLFVLAANKGGKPRAEPELFDGTEAALSSLSIRKKE